MIFIKKRIKTYLVLVFVGMFFLPSKINAQQDTIYYNIAWKETVKDSAAFFRPPVKKEGGLFRIKDYYASGQLQMSGLSKDSEKSIWHGEVSWYKENGEIYQIANYENNRLEGEFVTFLNQQKLVAIYKNGYVVEGALNRDQGSYGYYMEIANDTIKDVIYDGDIKGVRYENYSVAKGARFLSKYYGENGKLIGELETLDNGYTKGVEVFYYYEPMRVKQIRYYPYEHLLGETFFYENGQVRTLFELSPTYKSTFYAKDGTQLGSVTYTINNGYLKPENGTVYNFSYGYKDTKANEVISVKTYKDGKLQKDEQRYNDGTVRALTIYKDAVRELQISYNKKGEEIARMVYDNYYPLTGTEISLNKEVTYLDGELVKEIHFYNGTDIVFSEKTQDKETYYDKQGKIMGVLEIEYQNKYAKPINGKRYYVGYDTDISSIETYVNGFVKERTVFISKFMGENEKVDFKRTEYLEDNGYSKIREVVYYSNGSRQSDTEFKGYDKVHGKFYNDNNEQIGTYDYVTKNGTLYEFFPESNVIRLIQEEVDGSITKLTRYDYGPYRKYGHINRVLIEEIDVACCSKSYKKNGDVFAEAVYKDGKPWEGTVYDATQRTKVTIKAGKTNGVYKVFDYNQEAVLEVGQVVNDKREGVVKTYNYSGQLQSKETYLNNKLHGETIYYDSEGNQTSSLIYKDGKPFEGVKVIASGYNKKPTEESYYNGLVTQRVIYDEKGKRVSQYKDGKEVQTIAYHKDSDKKRLSYTVDGYYINGEVIRYDINGKVEHKAVFKNNELESGVVYLTSRDLYDKRIAYIIFNKQQDKLTVTMKTSEDEVVFFAEERLEQGYTSKYINKLNLYIYNLTPESLY